MRCDRACPCRRAPPPDHGGTSRRHCVRPARRGQIPVRFRVGAVAIVEFPIGQLARRAFLSNRSVVRCLAVVLVGAMAAPVFGQEPAETWEPPRLADGRPDLQGVWDFRTATPFERPEGLGETLTEEQAAAIESFAAARPAVGRPAPGGGQRRRLQRLLARLRHQRRRRPPRVPDRRARERPHARARRGRRPPGGIARPGRVRRAPLARALGRHRGRPAPRTAASRSGASSASTPAPR